ncbi:hypothetical protein ACP70R_005687 [Stipagrostis hirtigluma subsp. patula]
MFSFWHRFHPAPPAQPTFKILYNADEAYCLTVRDGNLALAPANPGNEQQHWFKDMRFGAHMQDEEGSPAFSLVNKATGLAMSHTRGPFHPVKLVPFNPDYLDDSAMWTGCSDLARGFGRIRTLSDVDLKLGAVVDGHGAATVRLSYSCESDDGDRWKILPWSNGDAALSGEPTFRVHCKAGGEGFSLTVRDGAVCLALTDPVDECQHWVEDARYGDMIRDMDGGPAFALVNRATGDAIKQPGGKGVPVKLVPYNRNYLDKSVLWSKSRDVGHGFQCIRNVDNIHLNLTVFPCDKDHDREHHGSQVVLANRHDDDNQHWRMVPWCLPA